jgi:hypothetical protein
VVPALLITSAIARPGDFFRVLWLVWAGELLGPFCERVLYGVPLLTHWVWPCVALVCLPPMFAHFCRPSATTGAMTLLGFLVWYAAAFLTFVNYEMGP